MQSVPAECLSSPSMQDAAWLTAFMCDNAAGVPTALLVTLPCPTPTLWNRFGGAEQMSRQPARPSVQPCPNPKHSWPRAGPEQELLSLKLM